MLGVGEHQLLVLLLVVEAELDDRGERLAAAVGACQQLEHLLVDVGAVGEHVVERRARQQPALRPRVLGPDLLVVRIEQDAELGMERPVVGPAGRDDEGFEEPAGVREVPLGRARVVHRLRPGNPRPTAARAGAPSAPAPRDSGLPDRRSAPAGGGRQTMPCPVSLPLANRRTARPAHKSTSMELCSRCRRPREASRTTRAVSGLGVRGWAVGGSFVPLLTAASGRAGRGRSAPWNAQEPAAERCT